jgi:hypothetical protein
MKLPEFRPPHVCFDILYLVRNTKGWLVFNKEKNTEEKGKKCTMSAMHMYPKGKEIRECISPS